jgi:hypothetical protein
MEPNRFEVYTSIDKAKRDELFQALRTKGIGAERQVVKFSGCEPVLGEDGKQLRDKKGRLVWQSNWSVAHPRLED